MSEFSAAESAFMERALHLAKHGQYSAHPNPMVGCVLVKDGNVVGEGWHALAGEPHAEINALQAAGQNARGATAFVTLEPCAHHGRTPPCSESLIQAGVSEVVVARKDPNPRVDGKGLQALSAVSVRFHRAWSATSSWRNCAPLTRSRTCVLRRCIAASRMSLNSKKKSNGCSASSDCRQGRCPQRSDGSGVQKLPGAGL